MRFLRLDDDHVLALDPQARQAGRRLVRLIAGNPVTMGQMTRHLPAAGPLRAGHHPHPGAAGRRNSGGLDTVASAITPYGDAAASQVAQRLDTDVLQPPPPRDRRTGNRTPRAARRPRRTPWRGRRRA